MQAGAFMLWRAMPAYYLFRRAQEASSVDIAMPMLDDMPLDGREAAA